MAAVAVTAAAAGAPGAKMAAAPPQAPLKVSAAAPRMRAGPREGGFRYAPRRLPAVTSGRVPGGGGGPRAPWGSRISSAPRPSPTASSPRGCRSSAGTARCARSSAAMRWAPPGCTNPNPGGGASGCGGGAWRAPTPLGAVWGCLKGLGLLRGGVGGSWRVLTPQGLCIGLPTFLQGFPGGVAGLAAVPRLPFVGCYHSCEEWVCQREAGSHSVGARDLCLLLGRILGFWGFTAPHYVDQNPLWENWVGSEWFLINWGRDLSHWDPQSPPGRSPEPLQRKPQAFFGHNRSPAQWLISLGWEGEYGGSKPPWWGNSLPTTITGQWG